MTKKKGSVVLSAPKGRKDEGVSARKPRRRTPTALAPLGSAKKRERQPSGSSRGVALSASKRTEMLERAVSMMDIDVAQTIWWQWSRVLKMAEALGTGGVHFGTFLVLCDRIRTALRYHIQTPYEELVRFSREQAQASDIKHVEELLALAARSGEPKAKSRASRTERKRATKGSGASRATPNKKKTRTR